MHLTHPVLLAFVWWHLFGVFIYSWGWMCMLNKPLPMGGLIINCLAASGWPLMLIFIFCNWLQAAAVLARPVITKRTKP